MTKSNKIIIVVLVLGLVAAGSYFYFFIMNSADTIPTTQPVTGVNQEELIATLQKLEAVSIDTTLFAREDFKILNDYTLSVQSFPRGRENPFEPAEDVEIEVVKNADLLAERLILQQQAEGEEETETETTEDEPVEEEIDEETEEDLTSE